MAKLIINFDEYVLPDGAGITEPCFKSGVPFNCQTGVCGSCLVQVSDGAENLSALSPEEHDLGLDPHRRLACKCTIQRGLVKLSP